MNPPLKFVAIAFSDYGGIGFEFYSAVVTTGNLPLAP